MGSMACKAGSSAEYFNAVSFLTGPQSQESIKTPNFAVWGAKLGVGFVNA